MTIATTTAVSAAAASTPLPWYRKFGIQVLLSLILGIVVGFVFPIGNSVATVVVAKWSRTFYPKVAERHLYPERYPQTARADAALADGNLLSEDTDETNAHPTGISMANAQ